MPLGTMAEVVAVVMVMSAVVVLTMVVVEVVGTAMSMSVYNGVVTSSARDRRVFRGPRASA
jgi:hypothetical protein